MHIWAHIFFYLSVLVIFMMIAMLLTPEGRARAKANKVKYIFVIFVWLGIGGYAHDIYKPSSNDNTASQEAIGGYEQLGHKINKHNVKKEKDGFYYTDKTNSKIRYFTDNDGTITAIKYSYMPNPENTTAVTSELANLLDDSHLKYGNDKVDDNDTLLKGDNYNVYSPKHKKWYHFSMQKDDDKKVSTFSVWQGKDSDAE